MWCIHFISILGINVSQPNVDVRCISFAKLIRIIESIILIHSTLILYDKS